MACKEACGLCSRSEHCKGKGSAPLCLTRKCLGAHAVLSVDHALRCFKWSTFEFLSKSTDLFLCISQQECIAHCALVPSTSCPFTPPLCNKICYSGISSRTKLPLWPGNIKPHPPCLQHQVWADCLYQTNPLPRSRPYAPTVNKQVIFF